MGRHDIEQQDRRKLILMLVIVLVGALVAGVAWFTVDRLRDPAQATCANPVVLNVVAAPDIAPVVDKVASGLNPNDVNTCYRVEMVVNDSAVVADQLAAPRPVNPPAVWVADSSVWLRRAKEKGAAQVPDSGSSIASSPVVMALAEPAAKARSWPEKQLNWADVIGVGGQDLNVGMVDPSVDAVGVSALIAVRQVTALSSDPAANNVAVLRKLSPNAASGSSELFAKTGTTASGPPITAFPTSERALLDNNAKRKDEQLVAVYPEPASPSLDYPYAVLPSSEPVAVAAAKFRTAMLSQSVGEALATNGLRFPDGRVAGTPPTDNRTIVRQLRPVAAPGTAQLDQVLNTWAGISKASRIQAVLDVSGSMNGVIPGSGKTRMQVTLEASEGGIRLMNPRTKLGIWVFSAELDGDKDYKEVLPVLPLNESLPQGALEKLRAIKATPTGRTGLYDTALAAYTSARQNWEPGRLNLVLILTDGKNDDDGRGVNRESLLAELGKMQDPNRPLPIVFIGFGPDVDVNELNAISKATGGQAFNTADPTKINEIFFAALSRFIAGRP
ncbi:substrate-binding and VWA domain-containing protein [Kibdelosporangium philippinense]|uniref:Substrate-binding and VWA domain-containing protein n=1 Tax=Kibdelosporangium philippinense TaxID=211113 RepID=A0ABS8ZP34_9PSEU|nr:substrate-binding domain-containing protein [Kibdelosporangium philippinense]MCE7008953.1 substrate-binding and VWA domain-containing protein [Kibdelosporangium philippinense]